MEKQGQSLSLITRMTITNHTLHAYSLRSRIRVTPVTKSVPHMGEASDSIPGTPKSYQDCLPEEHRAIFFSSLTAYTKLSPFQIQNYFHHSCSLWRNSGFSCGGEGWGGCAPLRMPRGYLQFLAEFTPSSASGIKQGWGTPCMQSPYTSPLSLPP